MKESMQEPSPSQMRHLSNFQQSIPSLVISSLVFPRRMKSTIQTERIQLVLQHHRVQLPQQFPQVFRRHSQNEGRQRCRIDTWLERLVLRLDKCCNAPHRTDDFILFDDAGHPGGHQLRRHSFHQVWSLIADPFGCTREDCLEEERIHRR